ncbi:DNA polymerase Y family protein [Adhaeribacter pallidiroseus]|uniref:DNA polymerase Y family protein n=1 Tax=Adhaeribacter pallidiroseus TaxID=2072847 RepID=UPI0018F1DD3D|nr:hypothetical protein [Adhaeribacter pallidiroseus]
MKRLRNSQLAGKPLITGGLSDRGVVTSCSCETRCYGVHAGMPIRMAKQLCEEALILRGDMEAYSKYSADVTQVIAVKAESTRIDKHYLDVMGVDRIFGTWKWTSELHQTIMRETGLPISFGLSVNKTVSKIATGQAKPNGALQVLITLNNLLVAMTEKLTFMLRQQEKLTSCITVKIRYANFTTYTQQIMIPYNADDHILIRKAKVLF